MKELSKMLKLPKYEPVKKDKPRSRWLEIALGVNLLILLLCL